MVTSTRPPLWSRGSVEFDRPLVLLTTADHVNKKR